MVGHNGGWGTEPRGYGPMGTALDQGFFRIIKYQGGGVQNPLPPSHKPPPPLPPPPFQFCKSSVLWFVTVHTYWGSPLHSSHPPLNRALGA